MKAVDCLREPGDVARRESTKDIVRLGPASCRYADALHWGGQMLRLPIHAIPGDDWQPLHPAADHAAEVKRLTAERDEAQAVCKREHNYYVAAQTAFEREKSKVNSLTARVAELEGGIREWITDADAVFESPGQMRAEWQKSYRRFKAALSPLPTAGDEADPELIRRGLEDIEAGRVVPLEEVMAEIAPAPAEPDSPAGERTLDAIPPLVTLLRIKAGYGMRQFAERAGLLPSRWSEIERGRVRPTDMELCRILVALSDSPSHHDAAVELAGRIAEGGGS